jgi:DNA anti-recombination protein RmuC
MDPSLVTNTLNVLNSQLNNFMSNPGIPTGEKDRVTSMRRDLDSLVKEYQNQIESINKSYNSRFKSKGDEIQNTIDEITRRLT